MPHLSRLIPLLLAALLLWAGPAAPALAADPQLQTVIDEYQGIVESLSNNSIEGLDKRLERIKKAAKEIEKNTSLSEDGRKMLTASLEMFSVETLQKTRGGLHLFTQTLIAFGRADPSLNLKVVRCGPAPSDWLQKDGTKIFNPYFGPAGKDCGLFIEFSKAFHDGPMPTIQGDLLPKSDSKPAPDNKAETPPAPPADKGK